MPVTTLICWRWKMFRYYSTQRPVDIGTYPKSTGEPIRIRNYNRRIRIEPWGFLAWGYLEYASPLDARQADDYELKLSPEDPRVNRKNEMLFQVIEHARKQANMYHSFSDWKDADDWLFAQFDITRQELEEIYANRGVMVYGASCVKGVLA